MGDDRRLRDRALRIEIDQVSGVGLSPRSHDAARSISRGGNGR
jgi:hypothetical protein